MLNSFRLFLRDESGATAIEYGLIATLVGAAIIGGAELLGDSVSGNFANVEETLDRQTVAPVVHDPIYPIG